jgi:hypothetical protein
MDLQEPETEVVNKRPPQVCTWHFSFFM